MEKEIKKTLLAPFAKQRISFFSKSFSVFRLFFVILQPEREIK
jgi:hypothetical protein